MSSESEWKFLNLPSVKILPPQNQLLLSKRADIFTNQLCLVHKLHPEEWKPTLHRLYQDFISDIILFANIKITQRKKRKIYTVINQQIEEYMLEIEENRKVEAEEEQDFIQYIIHRFL